MKGNHLVAPDHECMIIMQIWNNMIFLWNRSCKLLIFLRLVFVGNICWKSHVMHAMENKTCQGLRECLCSSLKYDRAFQMAV